MYTYSHEYVQSAVLLSYVHVCMFACMHAGGIPSIHGRVGAILLTASAPLSRLLDLVASNSHTYSRSHSTVDVAEKLISTIHPKRLYEPRGYP